MSLKRFIYLYKNETAQYILVYYATRNYALVFGNNNKPCTIYGYTVKNMWNY